MCSTIASSVGATIIVVDGRRTDLEVLRLMGRALAAAGLAQLHLDIGHPRIYRALVEGANLERDEAEALFHAVQQKDAPTVLAMQAALRQACAAAARISTAV